MGLVKKYKDYEAKELARRKAKKKKIAPYKELASKKFPIKKGKRKFSPRAYTEVIGNPYNVKFPKAKKILKRKKKRKMKRFVVYR